MEIEVKFYTKCKSYSEMVALIQRISNKEDEIIEYTIRWIKMFCKNCKAKGLKKKMAKAGVQHSRSGDYQRYVCSRKDGCGTMLRGERLTWNAII